MNTCPVCLRSFATPRGLTQHRQRSMDAQHVAAEPEGRAAKLQTFAARADETPEVVEPVEVVEAKPKRKAWQTDPVQTIANRTLGPAEGFERGKWWIRCNDHGETVSVGSRRAARRTPTLAFCSTCVAEYLSETR